MNGQPKNDADYASDNDSPSFVSPDQLPSSLVSSNRDIAGIPPPPNLNEPRKNNVILSFRKGSCKSPDRNIGVATDCNDLQSDLSLSPNMIDDLYEGDLYEGCMKFLFDSPSLPSFPSENSNGEKPNVAVKRNFQSKATMDVGLSFSASAPLVSPTPKKARYGSSCDPEDFSDRIAPLVSPPPMMISAPHGSHSCDPEIPQDTSDGDDIKPKDTDYLCGRSGGFHNAFLHAEKQPFQEEYLKAKTSLEKAGIAQAFIDVLRIVYGTRFLACKVKGKWHEIENESVLKKVQRILSARKPKLFL